MRIVEQVLCSESEEESEGERWRNRKQRTLSSRKISSSSNHSSDGGNMCKQTPKKGAKKGARKASKSSVTSPHLSDGDTIKKAGSEIQCKHLKKGVNLQAVKKKLKKSRFGTCDVCPPRSEAENGVWLCLLCGSQGCGRYSDNQHAVKHFEVPRTGTHPLVFHIPSCGIWCYECDNEVPAEASATLQNAVDFLKRNVQVELKTQSVVIGNGPVPAPRKESKSSNGEESDVEKPRAKAKTTSLSSVRVKGLTNMGNTCFLNSVVQVLMQTHPLHLAMRQIPLDRETKILLSPQPTTKDQSTDNSKSEIEEEENRVQKPLEVHLDDAGALTHQFLKLLREYHTSGSSPLTPSAVFKHISNRAPRFRGWQQQDSHELLKHLLDFLRMEELSRLRVAIRRACNLPDNPKKDTITDHMANQIKEYENLADSLYVDRVFGGSLIQSIRCERCNHISQKMEAFLDLSLPIRETKKQARAAMAPTASSDEDMDLEGLLDTGKRTQGASRHQQKKAKRMARRNAKSQKVSGGAEMSESLDGEKKDKSPVSQPQSEESEDADDTLVSQDSNSTVENGAESSEEEEESESVPQMHCEMRMRPLVAEDQTQWRTSFSIGSCLQQFTALERLTGKNKFGCDNCTKLEGTGKDRKIIYTEADKQYLVFNQPAVLILHLKRFQQVGHLTRKLSRHVEFPLMLDLAPYCSSQGERLIEGQQKVLYALYGVVSHSGGMYGGHYIAYAKLREPDVALDSRFCSTQPGKESEVCLPPGRWFYISDSHVSEVSESKVLSAEAYVLFYQRIV